MFAYELTASAQQTIREALALLERQLREPGASFTSSSSVRDWLRLQLTMEEREAFVLLLLDNQHRLITHETLFKGTISHTEVHPREVVKASLKYNAAALIVAHCHPSGHAEPSQSDRRVTERLKNALDLVDVRLWTTSSSAEWISSRLLNGAGYKGGVLMKIISKRQAMAIYRQYPQSQLFRFCTGKYAWSGSICHYAGREVEDISGVLAVFAERRRDRNGPYVVLRSVTLN